jgi:hypothetical protein
MEVQAAAVVLSKIIPLAELELLIKVLPEEHLRHPHLLRVVVEALGRWVKTVKRHLAHLEMVALVLLLQLLGHR